MLLCFSVKEHLLPTFRGLVKYLVWQLGSELLCICLPLLFGDKDFLWDYFFPVWETWIGFLILWVIAVFIRIIQKKKR